MIGHARSSVEASKARILVMRVFLLVVGALIVDLLAAGTLGALATKRSADHLGRAARALARDDVEGFESGVVDAARAAYSAHLYMSHPGPMAARSAPGFATEVEALSALADSVSFGVTAAVTALEAFDRVGIEGSVADAVFHNGAFDLGSVQALSEAIEEAADPLAAAVSRLSGVGRPSLTPLANALDKARARVIETRATLARAGSLTELLPGFAGGNDDRMYLLAFQSPSEARGGGGLIGVYGLLSARVGRMELEEIGPIEDLGPRVRLPVRAPADFVRTYGPLSALNDFRQVNLSPDFPTTARVLLRLYERVRGEQLDGVVAMDPLALGEMTRGTGPLEASGWDRVIDAESARRSLLFDIYREFVHREREQNDYLRALVDGLWSRIATGDVDFSELVTGIQAGIEKQHLKLYSADAREQYLIGELGASGDPASAPGLVHTLFNNNNSGNKLDFFLRREQEIVARLGDDGSAQVDVGVDLFNDIPRRGLRAIGRSGVASGLELGVNRMSLHFLLPSAAENIRMSIDGIPRRPFLGEDSGFATAWRVVTVPADDHVPVELSYSVPDALRHDAEGDSFVLTLWPQATARPDMVSLTIVPPAARSFARVLSAVSTGDGARWSGRLRAPRIIKVQLTPTD